MGLFNNFVGDLLNTVTLGGARSLLGSDIGTTSNLGKGLVNGITLGVGGGVVDSLTGDDQDGKSAPQFNPNKELLDSDIDRIRQLGQTEPTELLKSSQIQLDQLSDDKKQFLGELAKRQQGNMQGSFDQLASRGGLSGGASERIARQGNRDSLFSQQKVGSEVGKLQAGVRAGDFASQQDLKNRALFATPQLQGGSTNIDISAQAANQNAKALFDANRNASQSNALSSLFSLGGAAAGAYFGGPGGRLAGAKLGGSLGNIGSNLFN